MEKFSFYKTKDGSTGLFDNNVNDIFHSKTGAKLEAFQKFVEPVLNFAKDEIKILDICFGIGYNTKTFLDCSKYNSVKIDALDINLDLIYLSPVILDKINNPLIKIKILETIFLNFKPIDEYLSFINSYIDVGKISFFDENMINFIEFLSKLPYKNIVEDKNNSNLHNIYYKYISERNLQIENYTSYNNINIDFYIGDARNTINNLNEKYDIVFLDGFSPQKSPLLWTINFMQRIKGLLHSDSIITSYSKSTPFRSTLKQLGFFVGKTFIDDIDMGSVASLNKNNILSPLSEYDLALLNTRSGIPYKDNKEMNLSSEQIIKNRENEQNTSSLISHTQFLRNSTLIT